MENCKLTVIIPNRDRMDPKNKSTQFLFKSICCQTNTNFNVTVIDGGSKNFEGLSSFLHKIKTPKIEVVQRVIEGKFHKTILNNVAIRSANTEYVMTTDADIVFMPNFFDKIIGLLSEDEFIESRTCYWNPRQIALIHEGTLDPFGRIEDVKKCQNMGRIKKRTTPGGCQCGHINIWNKIHGYDERYVGWGSEDVDLVARVAKAGYKIRWIGESREEIMLFHQSHPKIDHAEEMRDQNRNLGFFHNIKSYVANPDGWGDRK
jgi:predicted glycosyltransferase involved in capsule biosynthesis